MTWCVKWHDATLNQRWIPNSIASRSCFGEGQMLETNLPRSSCPACCRQYLWHLFGVHVFVQQYIKTIKRSFDKNWCVGRVLQNVTKIHLVWFRISNYIWSAHVSSKIKRVKNWSDCDGNSTTTFWFILLSCRNFGAKSEVCFLACTPLSWMLQALECWFSASLGKFSPRVSHRSVQNLQILRNVAEACSKDA